MIEEEFSPVSRLFLHTVSCDGDDCEERLPSRGSELIAITDAVMAGWLMRQPKRKLSGVIHRDYCPKCRKKENKENGENKNMVSGVHVLFGPETGGSDKED